jgi:hypothetical protein
MASQDTNTKNGSCSVTRQQLLRVFSATNWYVQRQNLGSESGENQLTAAPGWAVFFLYNQRHGSPLPHGGICLLDSWAGLK